MDPVTRGRFLCYFILQPALVATNLLPLQELSSTRASIQQKIALNNQRTGFIDKSGPELEAKKKITSAARNFKEATRITAKAKALLNVEKDSLEKGNIEGEILLKETEAADPKQGSFKKPMALCLRSM